MSELLNNTQALSQLRLQSQRLADVVKLPLRNKVWRGGGGDHAGAGAGSSLEFQDHRNYLAGDDPRHINWQAYARTGQYTMKVFREEVRPLVDLVCDVSASHFFDESKAARTVELLYLCAAGAWRAGASLQAYLLNGTEFTRVESALLQADIWPSSMPKLSNKLPPSEPPNLAAVPLRAQALRIFISDLLYPGASEMIMRALSDRSGRGIILAPACAAESDAKWDGNYEFVEPESDTHHLRRVEPALLKRYASAYQRHFTLWKTESQRHGVIMARVDSENELQQALQGEATPAGAFEM